MIYHESFVCRMAKHTRAKNCLVKLDKRTSLKQSFFANMSVFCCESNDFLWNCQLTAKQQL